MNTLGNNNNLVFTSREQDVLSCMAIGKTTSKDIAHILKTSPKTVETHIAHILSKMQLNARRHIVDYLKKEELFHQFQEAYVKKFGYESAPLEKVTLQQPTTHSSKPKIKKKNVFEWIKLVMAIFCLLICFIHAKRRNISEISTYNSKTLLSRQKDLDKIHHTLKPGSIVALVGPGGIGKTTLARSYAAQKKIKIVFEVQAEDKSSLIFSFRNIAEKLAQTEEQKNELKAIQKQSEHESYHNLVAFVYKLLYEQASWLLIFNDVDDLALLRLFLPPHNLQEGRVLVTTRNQNIQNLTPTCSVIQMEELTIDESCDLFQRLTYTQVDNQSLQNFIKQLPPYPLDVTIAAYYIKDTKISFEEYLNLIKSDDKSFHQHEEKLLEETGDYHQTRYSIIALTIDNLLKIENQYLDLLWLIATINPQNIFIELLKNLPQSEMVDAFLHDLKKISILMSNDNITNHRVFSLHSSTQEALKRYLQAKYGDAPLEKIAISLIHCAQKLIKTKDILTLQKLIPHFEALLPSFPPHLTKNISLQTTLGVLYFKTGQYTQARKILEKELIFEQRKKTINNKNIIKVMYYLGKTYKNLSLFNKAENIMRQTLSLCEQQFSQKSAKTIKILVKLVSVYRCLGDYSKAKDLFEQSLMLCEKYTPKNYFLITNIYMALCKLHRDQGQYKEAEESIWKSLKFLYKKQFSGYKLQYSKALRLLGDLYFDQGLCKQARELYEKSLEIYLKQTNPQHPKVLLLHAKLASVCRLFHEVEKGHAYLDQAEQKDILLSCPNVKGLVHYERAHLYIQQKKYDLALNEARQSLDIYTRFYGKQHIRSLRALNLVGYTLMYQGDLDQAERCLNEAFEMSTAKKLTSRWQALTYLSELYHQRMIRSSYAAANHYGQQAANYIDQVINDVKTYFPPNSTILLKINKQRNHILSSQNNRNMVYQDTKFIY